MNERITQIELDALALEATTKKTEPETANVSAQLLLHVITEVRRLRGLIVVWADNPLTEDLTGQPERPIYDRLMAQKAAAHALHAEARAIREEQGLT